MEIQTQEQIQKKLSEEFKEAMLAAAETGNFAKGVGRLEKAIQDVETKEYGVEELKSLLTENQSNIKKADPGDISALSKQRTKLSRELAEIEDELIDLKKTMLPDCEKEKLEAEKALGLTATMWIVHQKEAIERKIIELFRTQILPYSDAWKRAFPELCSGYRILSGGYPDLGSFENCSRLLIEAMNKQPQQERSMESVRSAKEAAKVPPDTKVEKEAKAPPDPETPKRFGVGFKVGS